MTLEEAKQLLFDRTPTSRILDYYRGNNFYEFNVSCGRDNITYKVYDNKNITE